MSMLQLDKREALRQQIKLMGLDSGLCRRLIAAVDQGTEDEVARVASELTLLLEDTPRLLGELQAIRRETIDPADQGFLAQEKLEPDPSKLPSELSVLVASDDSTFFEKIYDQVKRYFPDFVKPFSTPQTSRVVQAICEHDARFALIDSPTLMAGGNNLVVGLVTYAPAARVVVMESETMREELAEKVRALGWPVVRSIDVALEPLRPLANAWESAHELEFRRSPIYPPFQEDGTVICRNIRRTSSSHAGEHGGHHFRWSTKYAQENNQNFSAYSAAVMQLTNKGLSQKQIASRLKLPVMSVRRIISSASACKKTTAKPLSKHTNKSKLTQAIHDHD